MLLQVPAALREHHVLAALQAVIDHHHALRLRLVRGTNDGDWSLDIAAVRAVDAADLTRRVDIDGFDDALRQSTIHEQAEQALGRLSPFVGVMLQAVWFDAGTEHPGRLLLFIHHLAVDGVSWRILLSDLAAAWGCRRGGTGTALPPNGTSLRAWADRLAADATSPSRAAELPFWTTALGAPVRRLTNDASDPESRYCWRGQAAHLYAAGFDHPIRADPSSRRISWRLNKCTAYGIGPRHCALPRRRCRQCRTARSGGTRA